MLKDELDISDSPVSEEKVPKASIIVTVKNEDLLCKMDYQTWKKAHKYSWSSHVTNLEEMMQ